MGEGGLGGILQAAQSYFCSYSPCRIFVVLAKSLARICFSWEIV